jgi:5-(carboxyamino)imidazole ribonucleotide synthase
MLVWEARRMGYRTMVLDASPNAPAAQLSDSNIQAPVDDCKAALELAQHSDLVTMEWELIPVEILRKVAQIRPLHPSPEVLSIIQDRLGQKQFLAEKGFPQAPFASVENERQLREATLRTGFPCILKRRQQGYDGKGQLLIERESNLHSAAELLKAHCVLEAKIPFRLELSVILARTQSGKTSIYPVAENIHHLGILHSTRVPAQISGRLQKEARDLARDLARALGHVGVMAVEMFVLEDRLLVNEIAPRVHNSGHFTSGACQTSQFEQHLRAICGLGLGNTELLSPAVMVNLLGDLWQEGEPDWSKALRLPHLKLHLYGKSKPAPRRKMGHLLILGPNTEQLLKQAQEILQNLKPTTTPSL